MIKFVLLSATCWPNDLDVIIRKAKNNPNFGIRKIKLQKSGVKLKKRHDLNYTPEKPETSAA
jgi:hypothetical protein